VAKVLISVPDDLLQRIDREATSRGTTRSRFLEDAARRELGWPAAEQAEAAVKRAREALAPYGRVGSAELIRRDRDAHDAADRRRL
jgi:predicted transcriptional regulator